MNNNINQSLVAVTHTHTHTHLYLNNKKGITLIALVITIIVLVILASVAINLSLGNNGIFNKAKYARNKYLLTANAEKQELENIGDEIDTFTRAGGIKTDVLWDGDINKVNDTGSWDKSIEDYDYLILKTKFGDTTAKTCTWVQVSDILSVGYNSTVDKYHTIICMYYDQHIYLNFTSNKSIKIINGLAASKTHLVQIIGVKL